MPMSVVEQIKDRLPITDILSSYITLIPAGKQFKAKCPFHNERTASFSVSPERGLYYCFGCGAKGDIFTFVQQFEGVDFNGALKLLADRAGVELTRNDRKADNLDAVYEYLEKIALRYQIELQKNTEALLYLKGRGLSDESISEFRIGYAPPEWRFITNTCTSDTDRTIAIRAGLIKQKEGSSTPDHYDRFRGRIIFPLTDTSGRVVGFSGRMFPDTEEGPKYLNSPETEVFQKSKVLYGFDKAKFHIKRHNFAILVEGQMDLVISHQAGFRNTVATSGTAVSEQMTEDTHANFVVLSRLTPHLFLAFDGDQAGQKALSRAALVAITLGMNPKVVPVPQGVDPAEYISQNKAEAWKTLLEKSTHFIVHQTKSIASQKLSPHMVVRLLREQVFPFLARVRSPIEQNLYIDAIGKELSIEAVEISRELALFVAKQPVETDTQITEIEKQTERMSAKDRLLAFIHRYLPDELRSQYEKRLESLSFDEYTAEPFVIEPEQMPTALATIERDYAMVDPADVSAVADELFEKVADEFLSTVRRNLSRSLKEAEESGDQEQVTYILQKLAMVNQRKHE